MEPFNGALRQRNRDKRIFTSASASIAPRHSGLSSRLCRREDASTAAASANDAIRRGGISDARASVALARLRSADARSGRPFGQKMMPFDAI